MKTARRFRIFQGLFTGSLGKLGMTVVRALPIIFIASVYFVPTPAEMAPDPNFCSVGLPIFGLVADPGNPDKSDQCGKECTKNGYQKPWWSKDGYVIAPIPGHAGGIAYCCCKDKIVAAANPGCPAGSICLNNPLGAEFNETKKIPDLIGNVLKGLFSIIGTIALGIFIFGGFLWMTAFGEESKIKKGTDTMIWAGMGMAVIFGSYIAVDFILKAILGS